MSFGNSGDGCTSIYEAIISCHQDDIWHHIALCNGQGWAWRISFSHLLYAYDCIFRRLPFILGPPQLPCTVAGQEVNETSCLVHARMPLSSKKRHNSQKGGFPFLFFFFHYTLCCQKGTGLVHIQLFSVTALSSKMRSYVCLGTLCTAIRPYPAGTESARFRSTQPE